MENVHEDQILKYSKIPADINKEIYKNSNELREISGKFVILHFQKEH